MGTDGGAEEIISSPPKKQREEIDVWVISDTEVTTDPPIIHFLSLT